jgi:hypothetical protein
MQRIPVLAAALGGLFAQGLGMLLARNVFCEQGLQGDRQVVGVVAGRAPPPPRSRSG